MKIEIANLVATADLNESMDLMELSKLPFITYNPSRYFCAYFKDNSMNSKVSIFPSGKMIVVGAKSEEVAERDLQNVTRQLKKRGFVKEKSSTMSVRNIVVTVEIDNPINIEELQDLIPGFIYEPEQFPGAIFRPASSDVTVLIFSSGKMVVAGLKSVASIDSIVESVLEELNLQ